MGPGPPFTEMCPIPVHTSIRMDLDAVLAELGPETSEGGVDARTIAEDVRTEDKSLPDVYLDPARGTAFEDDVYSVLTRLVAAWRDVPREALVVRVISGGITNQLFLATTPSDEVRAG